jgi:ABC-type lipoprotein export system ATPase subunit
MDEPVISVENLTKVFSESDVEFKALEDVSFKVYQGEILGISGASGSGKTTLLGIIGCLETPTSGSLTLFGENIEKLNDSELSNIRLRKIGFIFQEHNLIPSLTVFENLKLPITILKKDADRGNSRVRGLLEKVGLSELGDRYPSQLSRGQRQRIAAVRALVNEPLIILADEPTSDLDPDNARILLDFLKALNEVDGTTIIIGVTDPLDFQGIINRSIKLRDGKIVD